MLDLGKIRRHIQTLDKGDDTGRRQAVSSLKDHEAKEWATAPVEATHALIDSLQRHLSGESKQKFLRKEIVTILGNMGSRSAPAIPQLVELLQDENPGEMREAAAAALGHIGRALLDSGCADQTIRTAFSALWLSSTHSRINQVQVAIALCKLKIDAPGLVRFLTSTLMANPNAALRKSASEALAWCDINEVDVVPALLAAALTDKDEKVRQVAEAGLVQQKLSHEQASHLCSKQLKASSYAETALRNCGPLAVPALVEALGMNESETREKAARTLGCLGESAADAVPALTRALQSKNLDFRLAAAKGLWNVTKNAEVVVPILIALLEEKEVATLEASEPRRRFLQTVMEALCRIGAPAKSALPALTKKTKDKNRLISESAFSAIKGIAPALANKAGTR